jgi:hypothetical protein
MFRVFPFWLYLFVLRLSIKSAVEESLNRWQSLDSVDIDKHYVLYQVQERFEVDIKELPEQIDTTTYSEPLHPICSLSSAEWGQYIACGLLGLPIQNARLVLIEGVHQRD